MSIGGSGTTSPWQQMSTSPKDGRWFLCLSAITLIRVGKPNRAIPELKVLRRERRSPESDGYWVCSWGHSVADHMVAHGLWADLDALPLAELYREIEERRQRDGGRSFSLPLPIGTGEAQPA